MPRSTIFTIIIHIACWLLFLSLPVFFLTGQDDRQSILTRILSLNYWLFYFVFLLIFYFNTYWLIPKLYLRKKYGAYFGIVLLLLVAVYYVRPFDRLFMAYQHKERGVPHHRFDPQHPPFENDLPERDFDRRFNPPQHPQRTDFVSLVLFGMLITLGMAIRIIQQWRLSEQRAVQAERDKANAELSFLKAQINPHFLFNTLNNIYSLAITKNENTAPSILKLSNIMRYVTDDITQDYVSLESEVACIQDYIDLQRLRVNKKVVIDFKVTGSLEHKQIAPLILMTFVENAFKYGISSHEASMIKVELNAEESKIVFLCQNKLFASQSKLESTGIGIVNTRERLQHLYPGKHQLTIGKEDGYFTVRLTLPA